MSRPTWTWRDNAACAKHPHIDFTIEPTERITPKDVAETREAAANICASCPVRNWCATDAEISRTDPDETVRPFGIHAGRYYDGTQRPPQDPTRPGRIAALAAAGVTDERIGQREGLTVDQVRLIRSQHGIPAPSPRRPPAAFFEHGTRAGYRNHTRRGQQPCDACREASNAYDRAKRRSKRAA